MALVNLKNVAVTRLNNSGLGFSVLEQSESKGKTYKTYWTVWATEAHGLSVGDVVNVSGFLSAKVGEPKTGTDGIERRYVELSLNNPRIGTGDATTAPPASQQPQPVQSGGDVWNQPQNATDEIPF
jgi:hypothetical protein